MGFEVDYVEFLDDALDESEGAGELRESWAKNLEIGEDGEREWWILKPGMSERGQGVRLFSSEEELVGIFEEWEVDEESEEEEEADDVEQGRKSDDDNKDKKEGQGNGIITSQLRHFIAQPYIHPPLLFPSPSSPSSLHKFHIRTYVLAVGALQIYIYRPMLALFAGEPYTAPSRTQFSNPEARDHALKAHLSNTCLQDERERDGSVGLFWDLPDEIPSQGGSFVSHDTSSDTSNATSSPPASKDWKPLIFTQICSTTAETFLSCARGMSTHFQPLPNAFEVFGLDFMVSVEADGELRSWLLEVNAFPDFRQTGDELKGLVEGLWGGVVEVGVGSFFDGEREGEGEGSQMVKVLDVDLGRR